MTDQPDHRGQERMGFLLTLRRRGINDKAVLHAMEEVPRERFVEAEFAGRSYADHALPIACGQTISQPYVVAYMTEQLEVRPHHRVLEVGTGSGYQAAILSRLAKEVYSIERLAPLLAKARQHFRALRIMNVRLRHGDGNVGMNEVAPFDAIIVTAAATHVPPELLEQLQLNGRMVVPMAHKGEQRLTVIERTPQGYIEKRMDVVKFVPLLPGVG